MSSWTEDKPGIIWMFNAVGLCIFLCAMYQALVSAVNHHQFLVMFWGVNVVVGIFLMAIHVPNMYPERLYEFDLHEFLLPVMMGLIFTISIVIPEKGTGSILRLSTWIFIPEMCVLWVGVTTLIRAAGRMGSKIAQRQMTRIHPEMRSAFISFQRNGCWGACGQCPHDEFGEIHPERCVNFDNPDHKLPWREFVRVNNHKLEHNI